MAHDESNENLARLSVNFERRQYEVFSPNFRIDTGNPQQGYNGACVYDLYANTDEGDVSLVGMAQGGIFTSIMIELSKSLVVRKALKVV